MSILLVVLLFVLTGRKKKEKWYDHMLLLLLFYMEKNTAWPIIWSNHLVFSFVLLYMVMILLGSVWIEFILLKLKTENWKHCSKIIFKCVNSTLRPIFNEKFNKKWNLWVRKQCTDALFTKDGSKVAITVYVPYMNSAACWEKT